MIFLAFMTVDESRYTQLWCRGTICYLSTVGSLIYYVVIDAGFSANRA